MYNQLGNRPNVVSLSEYFCGSLLLISSGQFWSLDFEIKMMKVTTKLVSLKVGIETVLSIFLGTNRVVCSISGALFEGFCLINRSYQST